VHAAHRGTHVIDRAEGEDVLAVDLSPEGNLAAMATAQLFDIHAEELRVDGVDPDLDEVRVDLHDVAVGVKEDELARGMREAAVVGIERLEELAPEPGRDQQAALRAPVVAQADGVHVGGGPHGDVPQVELVDHVAQPVDLRHAPGQVHHQVLGPAQELHPLPGVGAATAHEFLARGIAGVDPAQVRAVQNLKRRLPVVERRPLGQRRVLHLAHHARLRNRPAATPVVHILADDSRGAARPAAAAVRHFGAAEVAREALEHGLQLRAAEHGDAGQVPQVARGAVGMGKG